MHQRPVAGIALGIALVVLPGTLPAAEPYDINVISSLTGQAALAGKQASESLRIIETRVNAQGGIAGRPIRFVTQDDESSPQIAVQLATAIIAKRVPVIIGPISTANCSAVFPLVQDGPVLWCLTPGFHPPKGSYGFSSNASTAALIDVTVRYFHALGLNKIALLATTDASGQDGDRNLDAAVSAPDVRGTAVVDREYFNVSDVSVTAQMARIKASGAQALIAWASLTPFTTVLRSFNDAGLTIPIATTNANGSAAQLTTYANFMPKTLLIAAMLNQVPDQIPNGPIKRKVADFYAAYKTSLGTLPEGSSNLAWDAASILVDALKKYGPTATAAQIHDYVETLHDWVGINGVYDFRDGSQRGLSENNVLVTRWNPARNIFEAVSRAGGLPLK